MAAVTKDQASPGVVSTIAAIMKAQTAFRTGSITAAAMENQAALVLLGWVLP